VFSVISAATIGGNSNVSEVYFPCSEESSFLNYSLSEATHDDYAEVALTSNMDTITRKADYTNEVSIYSMVYGNSRRAMDYAPEYDTRTFSVPSGLTPYPNLGDDAGFWVLVPDSYEIPYYGQWYDAIWVCTNGFTVLDTKSHYQEADVDLWWTAANCPGMPSTLLPNAIVAPFWKDMKVTGPNAKIWTGVTQVLGANYFAVVWDKVPNYGTTNKLNSFGVWFKLVPKIGSAILGTTFFNYGSIITSGTIAVGFENAYGQGRTVPPRTGYTVFKQNDRVTLDSDLAANRLWIKKVTIEAIKTDENGLDDTKAKVDISGWYLNNYPGGINIQGYVPGAGQGEFSLCKPLLSAVGVGTGVAGLALTGLGLSCPPLAVVGVAVGVASLVMYFFPAEYSDQHPAPGGVNSESTAYVKSLARDSTMPDRYPFYAKDIYLAPKFIWTVSDESVMHMLQLRTTLDYEDETGIAYHLTTNPVVYTLNPSKSADGSSVVTNDWCARTIPDGHIYDFSYQYETVNDEIHRTYSVGTSGYTDKGYSMMGWSPQGAFSHYKVRGDSTICIDGYFAQLDDIVDQSPAGKRQVLVYVVDPFDFNLIRKTAIVLDESDPNDGAWLHRQVVVDGLGQYSEVRVGIGRTIGDWNLGYHLAAKWADVGIYDGEQQDVYCLHVGESSHGTVHLISDNGADASGSTAYTLNSQAVLHPVPISSQYVFDHWHSKGQDFGESDPLVLTLSQDYDIEPVFTENLLPGPPAALDPLLADDFSGGLASWTIYSPGNTHVTLSEYPIIVNAPFVHIMKADAIYQAYASRAFATQNYGTITITFSMGADTPAGPVYLFVDGQSGIVVQFAVWQNYFKWYSNGAWSSTEVPVSSCVWYHVVLCLDIGNKNFDIYINGELAKENAGFYDPQVTRSPSALRFQAGDANSQNYGSLWVDDVVVRKGIPALSDGFTDLGYWTPVQTAGSVSTDADIGGYSAPSMELIRGYGNGMVSAKTTFPEQTEFLHMDMMVRCHEADFYYKGAYVSMQDSSGNTLVHVAIANGYFSWFDGTWHDTEVPYSYDEWYMLGFDVDVQAKKFWLYVDGVLNPFCRSLDFNYKGDSISALNIQSGDSPTSYTFSLWVDDLLIVQPSPNVPPTASFVYQADGLGVDVDGSGSNDPDGSISSYAWNWGDGGSTGPTSSPIATHTYTVGGVYSILLTVTDNAGASGTASVPVTVPPPGAATLWSDDFEDDHALAPWTSNVGTGNVVDVVATPSGTNAPAGTSSLHVKATTKNYNAMATSQAISNWDTTKEYTLTLWFRMATPTSANSRITVVDDGRLKVTAECKLGKTEVTLSDGFLVTFTLSTNTWYEIEIRADPARGTYGEFELLVDGISKGTDFMMYNKVSSSNQLVVGYVGGSRYLGEAYWDNLSVFGHPWP